MAGSRPKLRKKYNDITYSMLMEALSDFEILYRPKKCLRTFSSYEVIQDRASLDNRDFSSDTLFVCNAEVAKILLERYLRCFCVVVKADSESFDWVRESSIGNRAVVLKQTAPFEEYEAAVLSIFVDTLIWETDMDRVVFSHGRLDRIISISESMLNNFVCITDTGHNLIAYSRGIEPPKGSVYTSLVEDGCYCSEEIERIETIVLPSSKKSSQLVVMEPTEDNPYCSLHFPLFINGSHLFHVVMVCENGSIAFSKNLFVKFMKRVTQICNEFWKNTVNIESPWHRLFISLINKQPLTDNYLKAQFSKLDLAEVTQLRLYYIPFSESISLDTRVRAVSSARMLNDGQCFPFMLNDALLVLVYSRAKEEIVLSCEHAEEDILKYFYEPYDITAGISQLFNDIRYIEFAYRQAVVAYSLRGPVKREIRALFGDVPIPCYAFDHALKFYLLTESHDVDIVEWSFKHSFLRRILDEDEELGTNTALLIWTYICHGRNATETARLMHVHRNTVLYHLSRIEKRFNVSFESPLLRSRIVLDFQRLLLERSI